MNHPPTDPQISLPPMHHPPTDPQMSHPPIGHPPISHPPTAHRRPVPTTAIADIAASGALVPAICATRTAVVPTSTSPKSVTLQQHHPHPHSHRKQENHRKEGNHRNHRLYSYSILLCVALPASLPLGIYLFFILSKKKLFNLFEIYRN